MRFALPLFIIAYLLFTSGLVFEAMQSDEIGVMDIPFSFGFSAERTGVAGVFSQNDIAAAEWLVKDSNQNYMIVTDCNGRSLMYGYIDIAPRMRATLLGGQPTLAELNKFGSKFYLLQTEWMTKNCKYIEWSENGIGLRRAYSLPDTSAYPIVFRQGDAIVYEVQL